MKLEFYNEIKAILSAARNKVYQTFPNSYALRSELSWTHYRLLMRVENENQALESVKQCEDAEK